MLSTLERSQTDKKTKVVQCAIYTRKSTEEGLGGDFTSLDSQREYCLAFIKSREPEGWKPYDEVYSDPGFSGGNMDRPALQKLISDAKQGKFNVVVCYKFDRLSRNTRDFLHILDTFERNGVAFVSVTQPIDTTSSIGRLMRSILVDFSQFEREIISERTRDKITAMAKKGKWFGGRPILGYDIDAETKKLKVNQEEAKQVHQLFQTYLRTSSLSETVRILDEQGVRMKRWTAKNGAVKGGHRLHKMKLHNLLHNPVYIGFIRHNKNLYKGEHEAIISESLFKNVHDLLDANNHAKLKRVVDEVQKHTFLLRGLIRCGDCNFMMIPNYAYSRGRKFFYYKCSSVNKLDKSACGARSIPAKALEESVVDRIAKLSQNKELLDRLVKESLGHVSKHLPPLYDERRRILAEVGRSEEGGNNLAKILAREGTDSPRYDFLMKQIDELLAQKTKADVRLKALEAEIRNLEARTVDAEMMRRNFERFQDIRTHLEPEELKEVIQLLVKGVLYQKSQSKITIAYRPLPEINFDQVIEEGRFELCNDRLRD